MIDLQRIYKIEIVKSKFLYELDLCVVYCRRNKLFNISALNVYMHLFIYAHIINFGD